MSFDISVIAVFAESARELIPAIADKRRENP
jgi:hypothetical protein